VFPLPTPGNTEKKDYSEVQVLQRCAEVQALEAAQVEHDRPAWLEKGRIPVLVGGHVGFIAAYVIGLFTIFHVARAYKKLEIKVRLPAAVVRL
jgi:hypothetical protein